MAGQARLGKARHAIARRAMARQARRGQARLVKSWSGEPRQRTEGQATEIPSPVHFLSFWWNPVSSGHGGLSCGVNCGLHRPSSRGTVHGMPDLSDELGELVIAILGFVGIPVLVLAGLVQWLDWFWGVITWLILTAILAWPLSKLSDYLRSKSPHQHRP